MSAVRQPDGSCECGEPLSIDAMRCYNCGLSSEDTPAAYFDDGLFVIRSSADGWVHTNRDDAVNLRRSR